MADFLAISLQKSGIYFPQPGSNLFSTGKQLLRPVPKLEDVSGQLNPLQNQRTSVIVWSPPMSPSNHFMPPSPPQTPTTPQGKPQADFSPKSPNGVPPRGRPRADVLDVLIEEGQNSYSSIRCDVCNRVFPREKSLQAHKRTHSGERPFVCDFPNCGKAFVQSGQLKTHQRLHTGEKPFACTAEGCTTRFTHANRHCSLHPYASLKRIYTEIPLKEILKNENSEPNEYKASVLRWLANYELEKEERNPTKLEEKVLKRKLEKELARQQVMERKKSRIEARKRMADARERWYGAMALVELADTQLNCN
ncbi:zinc finger protein 367-like [Montipora foliosa]|uniref:zinc finger protein 367-like n=1 Tax=Montipora foliosa TaxID=591990 RepID=UPI0035F1AE8E